MCLQLGKKNRLNVSELPCQGNSKGFLKLDLGGLSEHKNLKIHASVHLHFTASS